MIQTIMIGRRQRHKAVAWRSSAVKSSSSIGGGQFRSNGKILRNEEVRTQSSSSITEDEESQSLWQSSGGTRFTGRRCTLGIDGTGLDTLGPLKDSTVLLILLVVGRFTWTPWSNFENPWWWWWWSSKSRWWYRGIWDKPDSRFVKGKLVLAFGPRNDSAAASYARAASSAESKVPSHTRAFFHGSLISAANRPHGRFLTPLNLTSFFDSWPIALGVGAAVGSAALDRRMGGEDEEERTR